MVEISTEKLELNKILAAAAGFAVTDGGKRLVTECQPSREIGEVRRRLKLTSESDRLLFVYGVGKIEQFADVRDPLKRAAKGSALNCAELLDACGLLRSVRVAYNSIAKINDGEISLIPESVKNLYFDAALEEDIGEKIISPEALSDHASEKLYSIRSKIRSLNDRIRAKLSEYISGKYAGYLQDAIVTTRNDRFVIPVKAEHKSHVKGFVHDRSKTGATFFIEPEYVLELNNELIALTLDEKEETEAILRALSKRVGELCDVLLKDISILEELDSRFALAEYSYSLKCAEPKVNDRGFIDIIKGRHPLIDKNSVVPVSVQLGGSYNFLLLSGANTGGKTVTLKMCGLFCLMAACGLFIPAASGSSVAVFKSVYADIGDSQSIEESLSTFSSHLENIIKICKNAQNDSLVLIDELGGGTNPDEGQALAKAVVKHLLERGCKGIITTHFTPLKEFAYTVEGIENASMEFDADTLKPLYRIKIGMPGASNALAIARRLGMDEKILDDATEYLSEGARSFENVLRMAEESRVEAEAKLEQAEKIRLECRKKSEELDALYAEVAKEKEKIERGARVESRRIISERTQRAEELLAEIEEILKKDSLTESDVIRARTLKNKLGDISYEQENEKKPTAYRQATAENLKVGSRVFVVPTETRGQVVSFKKDRGEAEVVCGSITTRVKLKDLRIIDGPEPQNKQNQFKVIKKVNTHMPELEINVIGMTVIEALTEVDNFIDRAVTDNLEEVKVIHGVGTGRLRSAIAEHLKKHKNVESFRSGKYGEGESGVTFIKLK